MVYRAINEMFTYCQEGRLQAQLFPRMFEADDIGSAFRHMQTGRHIGKIVVKMPEVPHSLKYKPIEKRYIFSPTRSYLLVGGFGGIGRVLATWMVTNGARHLVIMSRSAGQSESDQAYVKELESQGCTVAIVHGSVEDAESVEQAVSASEHELAGIVNLSLVLQVGLPSFQTILESVLKLPARTNSSRTCHTRNGWHPKARKSAVHGTCTTPVPRSSSISSSFSAPS